MDSIDRTPTSPGDYAALNATWSMLTAGMLALTREDAPTVRELPVLGLASFALTKALAKEKVGVWVREPLVHEEVDGRPPKGSGLRYAVGELLTCTRCLGTWSALGLIGLRTARPREGRIVAAMLATAAMNDWLQAGFNIATARANAVAKLADQPVDRWPSSSANGPRVPA